MSNSTLHLTDQRVIRLEGTDATAFISDVLTCHPPDGAAAHWYALLSPQGKVQAEGLLMRHGEDRFALTVHTSVAESLFKRLRLYRLRAKFDLVLDDDLAVVWSAKGDDTSIDWHQDARTDGLGFVGLIKRSTAAALSSDGSARHASLAANGIAQLGHDFEPDDVFPHDIGMDQLGAIDFKKGCYVGQEVVSRMQHRGTARRRPVLVKNAPTRHDGEIEVQGRVVGRAGPTLNGTCVAIVRVDKVTGSEATLSGHPVRLVLPEWASYGFADSKTADVMPDNPE